jgi:hypothetical protein
MKNLLFIGDVAHVEYLQSERPEWLRRAIPVTGDPAVKYRLEQLGVRYIDEWGYLKEADFERDIDRAWHLAEGWWQELFRATDLEEFAPGLATAHDLFWPFEACLRAQTIYERLLTDQAKARLHVLTLPREGVVRSTPAPPSRASASLAAAVLRHLAAQAGRGVHLVRCKFPLGEVGRPRVLPTTTYPCPENRSRPQPRRIAVLCGDTLGQVRWQPAPPPAVADRPGRNALILDSNHYPWDLHAICDFFAERPSWELIWVQFGPAAEAPPAAATPSVSERTLAAAWQRFCTASAHYIGPYAAILGNPELRYQFRRLWREMKVAVRLVDSFQLLIDQLRPDIVISAYDCFTRERLLVRTARACGIRTAAFIHGCFSPPALMKLRLSEADTIFHWGQSDGDGLRDTGAAESRLVPVGSIRYHDDWVRYRQGGRRDLAQQAAARTELQLPPDQKTVLLLTAPVCYGLIGVNAHPAVHYQDWKALIDLARRRPDLTFVHRTHPSYDHFSFYLALAADAPSNYHLSWHVPIEPFLAAADVAVLVNYVTSAVLDAVFARLPIVFLCSAIPESWLHQLSVQAMQSTRSVQELERLIDRLCSDEDFRNGAQERADILLNETLGDPARRPTERLADALAALLERPGPAALQRLSSPERDVFPAGFTPRFDLGHRQIVTEWHRMLRTSSASQDLNPATMTTALLRLASFLGQCEGNPQELLRALRKLFRDTQSRLPLPAGTWGRMCAAAFRAVPASRRTASWIQFMEHVSLSRRDRTKLIRECLRLMADEREARTLAERRLAEQAIVLNSAGGKLRRIREVALHPKASLPRVWRALVRRMINVVGK